jgi:hypothetical protein
MIRSAPSGGSVLLPQRNNTNASRGVKRRRCGVGRRVLVGLVASIVLAGMIANGMYLHSQIVDVHHLSPRHPLSSSSSSVSASMSSASSMSMSSASSMSKSKSSMRSSNSKSKSMGERRRKTQGEPEGSILQRVQKDYESTWEVCRNASSSSEATQTQTIQRPKDGQQSTSLAPPAFLRALRDFTSLNNSTQGRDGTAPETCNAPSNSTSVASYKKYILIFPTASQDLRSIFLHCMKWLLDPAATEIWLLVPDETRDLLKQDVPYGNRILAWDQKKRHPLKVAFAPNLWEAVARVDDAASTSISTVFWVNEAWQGNHGGIHAGWELWKQDASTMVASQGWSLTGDNNLKEGAQDLQGITTTTICPYHSLHSTVTVTGSKAVPSLVDLVGSFHHRDYLCFLRHPVLAGLQANVHDWRDIQWAMAWWLTLVTGRSPRTFAPRGKEEKEIKTQKDYPLSIVSSAHDTPTGQPETLALLVSFFGAVTLRTKVDASGTPGTL